VGCVPWCVSEAENVTPNKSMSGLTKLLEYLFDDLIIKCPIVPHLTLPCPKGRPFIMNSKWRFTKIPLLLA